MPAASALRPGSAPPGTPLYPAHCRQRRCAGRLAGVRLPGPVWFGNPPQNGLKPCAVHPVRSRWPGSFSRPLPCACAKATDLARRVSPVRLTRRFPVRRCGSKRWRCSRGFCAPPWRRLGLTQYCRHTCAPEGGSGRAAPPLPPGAWGCIRWPPGSCAGCGPGRPGSLPSRRIVLTCSFGPRRSGPVSPATGLPARAGRWRRGIRSCHHPIPSRHPGPVWPVIRRSPAGRARF